MNIARILDETVKEYFSNPVNLLETNEPEGEHRYIERMSTQYYRTLVDIISYFHGLKDQKKISDIKIIEIGSFLGIVSISLAKIGFSVTALDIPEFMSNKNLQERYKMYGVQSIQVNLRSRKIPIPSEQFDFAIMCATLEHLNFNPLPVVLEINRILKFNGLLYLGVPNLASLANRLRLLLGKSINNPIRDFFAQLDKSGNMIVGLHWREYTKAEINEMLENLGFTIIRNCFSWENSARNNALNILRQSLRYSICQLIPSLQPDLTTVACKASLPLVNFYFCDANE